MTTNGKVCRKPGAENPVADNCVGCVYFNSRNCHMHPDKSPGIDIFNMA